MAAPKIPVLFCQEKSIYKSLKNCDVFDEKRDALTYTGNKAGIYHPPCRLWSRLRAFSKADEFEKYLGFWSIRMVRNYGGILEQPSSSKLFEAGLLPQVGNVDDYGGFTLELDQFHFGHKAQKRTWLYIVGIDPANEILLYRRIPGKPRYVVSSSVSGKKELNKYERSATPIRFAKYLVKIVQEINNSKKG